MKRISLSDNSGHWFDGDSARKWSDAVMLAEDGAPISRATGNSWQRETLYLTQYGSFVMHFSDERNVSHSQFLVWDEKAAVKWLIANGYSEDVAKLDLANPEKLLEI